MVKQGQIWSIVTKENCKNWLSRGYQELHREAFTIDKILESQMNIIQSERPSGSNIFKTNLQTLK